MTFTLGLRIKTRSQEKTYGSKLSASSYLTEISTTELCQVMLKSNSDDEWIFGINFLNQYTVDFDIDN